MLTWVSIVDLGRKAEAEVQTLIKPRKRIASHIADLT